MDVENCREVSKSRIAEAAGMSATVHCTCTSSSRYDNNSRKASNSSETNKIREASNRRETNNIKEAMQKP
jgi:hypothetical protein